MILGTGPRVGEAGNTRHDPLHRASLWIDTGPRKSNAGCTTGMVWCGPGGRRAEQGDHAEPSGRAGC